MSVFLCKSTCNENSLEKKNWASKLVFTSNLSYFRLELTFSLAFQSASLPNKISSQHQVYLMNFQFQTSNVMTWWQSWHLKYFSIYSSSTFCVNQVVMKIIWRHKKSLLSWWSACVWHFLDSLHIPTDIFNYFVS